jgi:hypothetical protein
MPTFSLTFDVEISEQEQDYLCDALGCIPANLKAELDRYGPAAVREYIDMFTGAVSLATATDIRERRLLGMMLTRFQQSSPAPDTIARLFNITPSAARALLRSAAGKHRLRLAPQLNAAIKAVLDAAMKVGNTHYTAIIHNSLVLELLNAELAAASDSRTAIRANGTSANSFLIDVGSFDYLRSRHPR